MNRAISDILDLQIDIITPGSELKQSTEAAYLYDAAVYDSCYLALDQLMGVEVYTSDKKFYEKANKSGILKFI